MNSFSPIYSFFVLILIASISSSCASIMNDRQAKINFVFSDPSPTFLIIDNDTISVLNDHISHKVDRQKDDLRVFAGNDSISKLVTIAPKNSFNYWLNAYPLLWPGFYIDRNNPKRFTYPSLLYIDLTNESDHYLTYDPRSRQGQLFFQLDLPWVNSFLLKPDGENNSKLNTGFLGLSIGLDYYHFPRQFVNFSISSVMDFFLPAPAPVDYIEGEYEFMNSIFTNFSNNHHAHKFILGYGISFSRNTWTYNEFGSNSSLEEPIVRTNYALGVVLPVYYQLGEKFYIGIKYRPTFFRFSTSNPVHYEHLISFGVSWKFRLL